MNQKKAKAIRRAVRAQGMHTRAIKLISGDNPVFIAPTPVQALMGWPGCTFTGQRIIEPTTCGRGLYRSIKKAIRNGQAAQA